MSQNARAEAPEITSEMDNRLYICWPTDEGFTFASKSDSNILVDDVFFLYQTYGAVNVSYTKDNITQYAGESLKDTWIRCTLMEGGHLVVKHDDTIIYDGYTWNTNSAENTFKYRFGMVGSAILISFLASLPLVALLIIIEFSRRNQYILGGKTNFNKDEEEKQ
jgi:hypothetical protein